MPFKDLERERQRAREKYKRLKETDPFRHRCLYVKIKAKRFSLPFDLTPDYLQSIWTGVCAISKIPIYLSGNRVDENHAEIDRRVPALGYTKGNVMWTSRKFNRIKGNATVEELQTVLDALKKEYGG